MLLNNIEKQLLDIIPTPYSNSDAVIFFEAGNSLNPDFPVSNFREFLIENKVRHNCIYNIREFSKAQLVELIGNCIDSVICFETTNTYHEFNEQVQEIITRLSNEGYRFIIIECYMTEPLFYKIPKNVNTNNVKLYSLDSYSDDTNDWELIKRE